MYQIKVLLILLIILYSPFSLSQPNKEIIFVVTAENVPGTSSVFIAGNHRFLGNWNVGVTQLEKKEHHEWIGNFLLPAGYHLEYKLTLGSWEKEATNAAGIVPGKTIIDVENSDLHWYRDADAKQFASDWTKKILRPSIYMFW